MKEKGDKERENNCAEVGQNRALTMVPHQAAPVSFQHH